MMEPILDLFGWSDPDWLDPVVAILIALAGALIFYRLLFPLINRFTKWTPTDLDTRMAGSARWPITLGIVVLGVTWR